MFDSLEMSYFWISIKDSQFLFLDSALDSFGGRDDVSVEGVIEGGVEQPRDYINPSLHHSTAGMPKGTKVLALKAYFSNLNL